ncbi:hypothetical protein GWO43_02495 [candidate division KSB1 bacterium]|nr:hypothetical protein [candidate division KSB1 bacterium]NIR69735.1 hypothetical protein [candidate division KSB1 bacterium]NIS22923.1 hypothetical protein [candidate division KSB1 bacterium]NIT69780.1 hypothetical protein [candidate division KSB1 bacterium]NIU23454.1 hypothetical protein [candidate division KSB1 bacterium]
MEFDSPVYQQFRKDFDEIAKQFSLDPNHLKVEFYTPHSQAILIEEVEDQVFKIHINLEDNRIISFQRLGENGNGNAEYIKNKYRKFMK